MEKIILLTIHIVLSAAALRRRLLEQKASAVEGASLDNSGAKTPVNLETTSTTAVANGGVPKSHSASRSPVKIGFSRTPELVLLGDSGTVDADDLETTEPVDGLPKRKIIQLSSTNPIKGNLQKKADGTVVLRFPDSSEV